ncbi:hypothetical protein L484_017837 [Morus notabilis]|uniref:Uncharacterized protein n=1 Tax=Morus notabilis TaxID=981085 RepID=W9R0F2_9ROSA|nr:hypothetical protein L484_017837 [Morus notabilis]
MASDGEETARSESSELNLRSPQDNERQAVDEYDLEAQKTKEPQESPFEAFFRYCKDSGRTIEEALNNQEMPKQAITWAFAFGAAVAIMYQKDPKPMSRFMEVVAWFVPLSVTALFIGILCRRQFPRFAFIATLLGYNLIFGSLFCLFSFFLEGHFTAFIPMACWVIIFIVLIPALIHGLYGELAGSCPGS